MKKLIMVVLLLAPILILKAQDVPYHVAFDLTSKDTNDHKMVVRWLTGISSEKPEAKLEVVLYGQSLDMIRKDKSVVAAGLAKLANNKNIADPNNPDEIFKNIKGKHKVVFDATKPHEILPFAWPRVFLVTNEKTGTPEKDNSVVVVLRHAAIPYAFEDRLWEKYKFGEVFKADDPATKTASLRNPFWKPKKRRLCNTGYGSGSHWH